jgi:thioredoxin-like negative regulator of GroEL
MPRRKPKSKRLPGSPGQRDQKVSMERQLGSDFPELSRARYLWQANRFDESLTLFEEVVKRHPTSLVALIDAARAFGRRHEIKKAEAWLDQATQLAGSDLRVLHLVAQSYRMIFRPIKAKNIFAQICQQTEQIPDALLELAILHERNHELNEAADALNRLLARHSDYQAARLIQARVFRRWGDFELASKLLIQITQAPSSSYSLIAEAWAELAMLADESGEFDEAMRLIDKCKSIQLAHEGNNLQISNTWLDCFDAIEREFTSGHVTQWKAQGSNIVKKPPSIDIALLTGFPRTGTTLLEQVLSAHPQISNFEELELFARDIFPRLWHGKDAEKPSLEIMHSMTEDQVLAIRNDYLRGCAEYSDLPLESKTYLDKNPTLTLLAPAFVRLFPHVKILFAVRDPRDVILSCYLRYLPINNYSVWFFTLERTAQRLIHDLEFWCRFRENIPQQYLEVRYEDTVVDLRAQAQRCLDFLGRAWHEDVLRFQQPRSDNLVRSPSYVAVSQPVTQSRMARWRNYERHLEPVLESLEPILSKWGYN